MATANFNIGPEDGWVAVTSAGVDFIRISREPASYSLYVASGSTSPDPDGTQADGVITFGGQPNNTGTVTVGSITYTFVTSFDDPGLYDVKIGANQAASEAALTAAINGRAAIAATAATGSVIFGGLPTALDTLDIGDETYTFVVLRAAPFEVTIGASATITGDNLVTALTADSDLVTGINTTGTVALTSIATGFAANSITLVEAADNTTVSGAALTGGNDVGPAISANVAVTAVDGAGTVTVTSTANGVAGNSVALSESATNITVDGSGTLEGGTDALSGVFLSSDEVFFVDVAETENFYVRTASGPVRVDVYYNLT